MHGYASRASQTRRRNEVKRPDLVLHPVYPGQPVAEMIIQAQPDLLTTTVTTGVCAISNSINPTADVQGWATRFQSLWKEYRVVKYEAEVCLFSSTNPGLIKTWVGTTSGVPTSSDALDALAIKFNASAVEKRHILTWVPSDPADLAFTLTSGSANPAYYKLYTDAGNFGAPTTVTILGTVSYKYWVQFREYV